jgi:hypothetical protein
MTRVHVVVALGTSLAFMASPGVQAQSGSGRSGPPPGVFVTPRPAQPLVGFGTLHRDGGRARSGDRHADRGVSRSTPFRSGFGIGSTLLLGSTLMQPQPVPVPTPVPYPVPYYYPVRVRKPASEPAAPAIPYDPAKSRTLTIGAGADGGGGVMRIQQLGDSVVQITWLGSVRPIREARLFLADSLRQALRSQMVTAAAPSALFRTRDLEPRLAFTGLTIVYADGATATTLVPYRAQVTAPSSPARPADPARPTTPAR